MVSETERKFIIDCIHLYKELPALWNKKIKKYYNSEKKNAAYEILLTKYREMYPNATKDDLKKKFNSLRTNHRKELKKRMDSIRYGCGDEDSMYQPTLWYFNEFSFLNDENETLGSESSFDNVPTQEYHSDGFENTEIIDEKTECNSNEEQNYESRVTSWSLRNESPSHEVMIPSAKKRRTTKHSFIEEKPNISFEDVSELKDELYYWAISCAADLRKMEKSQQVFAKKAIADVLMEGQLGQLNRHSVKINESSTHTQDTSQHSSTPLSSPK